MRRSQPGGLSDGSRGADPAAFGPATLAESVAPGAPVRLGAPAMPGAPVAPTAAPAPGLPAVGELVLEGKYRIDGALGAGGMGVVMAAEHVTLGQKVAFKFLAPRASSDAVTARFVREARAAARLDSEHVVRVSDVGVLASGAAYMLMERLEGEDLGAYLRRVGPLPFDEAVLYVLQTCDAVAAAHAAGIIHRDLKPTNLFLARWPDGHRAVKVLDFGISKASGLTRYDLDQSLTRPGAVLGSPLYMSPEQVRDTKSVDARTDVWSLGMVLYELLVGSPMYNIDTLPALCAAIVADPPVPLRSQRPDAPPELEAAVLRCTQKDPAQRFASVAEFAQAIAPFTAPEGALLAARAARRLAARGDALQLARVSVSGTFSGGPRASVPAPAPALAPASAPASAPPAAPRRWQGAALALGGTALATVAVAALLLYARRAPSDERRPIATPTRDGGPTPAPIARDGGPTPAPIAPSGPSGPTIEPVAPAATVTDGTTATTAAPAAPATRLASPAPSIVPAPRTAESARVPTAAASSATHRRPPPPGRPKPSNEFDDSALRNRR